VTASLFNADVVAADGAIVLDQTTRAMRLNLAADKGIEILSNSLGIKLDSADALQVGADGLDLKSTIAGARTFSDAMTMSSTVHVVGAAQFDANVTIDGNLIVKGSTTTVESETVTVKDPIIQLNVSDSALYPVGLTGLSIHRGMDGAQAREAAGFVWDEVNDKFIASFLAGDVLGASLVDAQFKNIFAVDATLTGDLEAVNAVLSGDLDAVNADLSGNLAAVDANLSGDLAAVNGSFSGDIDAVNAALSGNLGAVDGNFSGDLAAVNAVLSGNLGAVNATLSGDLAAVNAVLSGDLDAVNGTFTGDIAAVDATLSGNLGAVDGAFSGNVSIVGTLGVTGKLTADDADITGDVTLGLNAKITNAAANAASQIDFAKNNAGWGAENPLDVAAALDALAGMIAAQSNDLQDEVDAIEAAIGLNADGTYAAFSGSNYMDAAGITSIVGALSALDAAAHGIRVDHDDLRTDHDDFVALLASNQGAAQVGISDALASDLALQAGDTVEMALDALNQKVIAETNARNAMRMHKARHEIGSVDIAAGVDYVMTVPEYVMGSDALLVFVDGIAEDAPAADGRFYTELTSTTIGLNKDDLVEGMKIMVWVTPFQG
jgi:putative sterol carrier protein